MASLARLTAAVALLLSVAAADRLVSTNPPAAQPSVDARSLAATPVAKVPDALRLLLTSTAAYRRPVGDEFEVWVCSVPTDTTDPTYYASTLRLSLDPSRLASLLDTYVPPYFEALSHDRYSPRFVAGDTYTMTATDSPQTCLNHALDRSDPGSDAVLAIATAEHDPSVPGGFGTPGNTCRTQDALTIACSASVTRRGAYVGASDFHPDWGDHPPLDLVEHEIGHTLGWPHSGSTIDAYASELDVMSNSAAPRDSDPTARDGQGTLAVNQLAAGWLPSTDVLLATQDGGRFQLAASNDVAGPRLLILPVDRRRFLTVEYLSATGLYSYLPTSGVTVTLVNQSATVCDAPRGRTCLRDQRQQRTLVGSPPYDDLLTEDNAGWSGYGWCIDIGAAQTITVTAEARLLPRCS